MRPQQCHGDLQLPHFWAPTLAEPQHTELCGANGAHTLHSESANYHPALSQLLKDLLPRHTHLSCAETHQAQLDPHLGPCKPSSARLGSELAQDQQVHLSHGTAPEPRHCSPPGSSLQQLLGSGGVCGLNFEAFPQHGKLTVLFKCNLISQTKPTKTLKKQENLTCANPILPKYNGKLCFSLRFRKWLPYLNSYGIKILKQFGFYAKYLWRATLRYTTR